MNNFGLECTCLVDSGITSLRGLTRVIRMSFSGLIKKRNASSDHSLVDAAVESAVGGNVLTEAENDAAEVHRELRAAAGARRCSALRKARSEALSCADCLSLPPVCLY